MHDLYVFSRQRKVFLLVVMVLYGLLTPTLLSAHTWSPPLGYTPPEPGTYELPVVKPAIDGEVLDTAGVKHRLFDYMGDRIVLLSFIYTRCSDARGCPLAASVFYAIKTALEHDATLAQHVRLLTLSFDPDYDTPAVMRRHAGAVDASKPPHKSSPLWHHLTTTSPQTLQPMLDGYGQYVVPVSDANGHFTGTYSHLLKVFLIDRQRRVRNIYSVDFLHPQVLINDTKTLLMTEQSAQVE